MDGDEEPVIDVWKAIGIGIWANCFGYEVYCVGEGELRVLSDLKGCAKDIACKGKGQCGEGE